MTYNSFEDLPVWPKAAELRERADELLETAPSRMRASFRDQLERAVLSVSNNIAEGFERGTTNELLQFAGEVRSMLTLLRLRPWAKVMEPRITELKDIAENCSRQLRGWADSLQNSEIKGQRHLTDAVRRGIEQKKRAAALQEWFDFKSEIFELKSQCA
jgi:four helix bundle protein